MTDQINRNDFALVIGINNYPYWNNGKRNLKGPVKDAQEFLGWIKDSKKGGGIPEDNVVLVTSEESEAKYPKPEVSDITRALRSINRTRYEKYDGEQVRRLYIFFSGHGHTEPVKPRDSNLCMAPFNDFDGLSEAISLDDILSKTIKCIAPDELIVFLDCCRSIVTNAAAVETTFACQGTEDNAGNVNYVIFYSTQNYKLSYESGDENEIRGHFSRALMAGLNGGAEVNGKITLESLYNYLNLELPRLSDNPKFEQQAKILSTLDALKDVHLGPETKPGGKESDKDTGAASTANVIIRFSPERTGEIILENGLLEEIHKGDAGSAPWELNLERGAYSLIETANDSNQHRFDVRDVTVKQEIVF